MHAMWVQANDFFDPSLDLLMDHHRAMAQQQGRKAVTELRRARIKVNSEPVDALVLKLSADFNENDNKFELKDAYIRWRTTKKTGLTVGRKKQLGGMDQSLGLSEQFLMERSLANSIFGLGRLNLVEFGSDGEIFNFALNAGEETKNNITQSQGGAVKALYHSRENSVVSTFVIGANGNWNRSFREEEKLGSEVITEALNGLEIKRSKENLKYFSSYAGEMGVQVDKWIWQGEYFVREENIDTGVSLQATGFYHLLNFNLRGNTRKFSQDAFATNVKRSWAAEISGRYSRVTLQSLNGIREASTWAIGANIYPSKRSKLALQYERGELEARNIDISIDSQSAISFRFQYEW